MNLLIFIALFIVPSVLGHVIIKEIVSSEESQDRSEIDSNPSQGQEQQQMSEDQETTVVAQSRDDEQSNEEKTIIEEQQENTGGEQQPQEDHEVTTSDSANPRCSATPGNHVDLRQTSENLNRVLRDFSEFLVNQIADRVRDQQLKDLQATVAV